MRDKNHFFFRSLGVLLFATTITPAQSSRFIVPRLSGEYPNLEKPAIGEIHISKTFFAGVYPCEKTKGDNDDTHMLQSCVDKAGASYKEDGGLVEVVIPSAQRFVSGALNLTSGILLRIDGTLVASTDPDKYPVVPALPGYGTCRDSGFPDSNGFGRHQAFLSGWNMTDIILTGHGVVDGQGLIPDEKLGTSWVERHLQNTLDFGRPRLFEPMFSSNVQVWNLTFQNQAFWALHPYASRDIYIGNVTVIAPRDEGIPNDDGIDPDSCDRALIETCYVDVGDNSVAIKSGMDFAGREFATPASNIVFRDSTFVCETFAVGSEMSGGVFNVTVANCTFGGDSSDFVGVHLKTTRGRGGSIHDLVFRDVNFDMRSSTKQPMPFSAFMHYGGGNPPPTNYTATPRVYNVLLDGANILLPNATSQSVFQFTGLNESLMRNFTFRRVNVSKGSTTATNPWICNFCADFDFIDVFPVPTKSGGCLAERRYNEWENDEDDNNSSNSTQSWLDKRDDLIDAVFGRGRGVLTNKSIPDRIDHWEESPEVSGLVWNLTDPKYFEIESTVFYAPRENGERTKTAFFFHHGHSNCICPTNRNSLLEAAKCKPGCNSSQPAHDELGMHGFSWWDLYNVSQWVHDDLEMDVFIFSMPLKGVNLGPGSNATVLNTNHWWFLQWELRGDHPLRYFLEPVVLTANYASKELGYESIVMAGLSGGGWSTTFASALDKRIQKSWPIAGSVPCALRNPLGPWPYQNWTGNDDEDYEQSCMPPDAPVKGGDDMPGRPAFLACNYTCQYLLAGLEPDRFQVQVLHEYDSCCFSPHGRHDAMRAYETNIRRELAAREESGWFTVTSNEHIRHEVCAQDKTIIEKTLSGSWDPAAAEWNSITCDIIHTDSGGSCAPDVEPGCTNPSDPFNPGC